MAADQFALFPSDNAITVSWFGQAIPDFSIRVRSLKSQRMRDCIAISNRITPSEAYTRITDGVLKHNLQLQFKDGMEIFESGIGFELYQNQPNPFNDKTWIRFYLPENDEVSLIISDASGKTVQQRTAQFGKGLQSFVIDRQWLNTAGLWYYTLKTRFGSETKKMIYTGSMR
jgi:hypothetical protein